MAWAPDYASTAELKAFARITDTVDDTEVGLALAAASRTIDTHANRQFGATASAEARRYTAEWDRHIRRWRIVVDDFQTLTGLEVLVDSAADETFADEIVAAGYDPLPWNASQRGRPWTELEVRSTSAVFPVRRAGAVQVTATWGWTAVPNAIKQACLLQASRLLARRDSPHGVAGASPQGEIRLLEKLDPDVAVIVGDYRRPWSVAR